MTPQRSPGNSKSHVHPRFPDPAPPGGEHFRSAVSRRGGLYLRLGKLARNRRAADLGQPRRRTLDRLLGRRVPRDGGLPAGAGPAGRSQLDRRHLGRRPRGLQRQRRGVPHPAPGRIDEVGRHFLAAHVHAAARPSGFPDQRPRHHRTPQAAGTVASARGAFGTTRAGADGPHPAVGAASAADRETGGPRSAGGRRGSRNQQSAGRPAQRL